MRATIRKRRNPTVAETLSGFVLAGLVAGTLARGVEPAPPSAAAPLPAPTSTTSAPAPRATPTASRRVIVLPPVTGPDVTTTDCDAIEDFDAIEDPDVLDFCEGER